MDTKDMKITIGHLYPDLLNLYGDRGNIACLMKRCIWRGIEAETIEFNTGDQIDFSKLDIVLLGEVQTVNRQSYVKVFLRFKVNSRIMWKTEELLLQYAEDISFLENIIRQMPE